MPAYQVRDCILMCRTFAMLFQTTTDFYCPICQLNFSRKSVLVDHLRGIHGFGNPFKCPCGQKFNSRASRDRHRKLCANKDGIKKDLDAFGEGSLVLPGLSPSVQFSLQKAASLSVLETSTKHADKKFIPVMEPAEIVFPKLE